MSYNHEEFPNYVKTAGKVTVVTALTGLLVFTFAFIFDVGTQEFNKVSAQSATTTLTVLNTPPTFTLNPYEVIESSTSTPTNSGDVIQWSAVGSDANAADYYLLICSTNASPTPNSSAAPACGAGAVQWGVSTSTVSDTLATVSTTTLETASSLFDESNTWYAWVCDGDATDPRCTVIPEQGDYATSSSPFHVNNRPVFTDFNNNGPADPAAVITFYSTSSDPDVVGGEDQIYLVVCGGATDYSTSTNTCADNFIASTTISFLSDATATYTLPPIIRDQTYGGYGNIVDVHGHEAVTNPINQDFTVNNVAPTVSGGDIDLYGELGAGSDLTVSVPAGETPSSTIEFKIKDANSCLNAASSTEIIGFSAVVFRSGVGTSTCDGTGTNYDPNNCYDNGVPTTTWALSCNATSTCASPNQDYVDYSCTFPLWFVADPTDNGTNTPAVLEAQNWSVGIAGIDDNFATGTMATTSNPKELISFSSIDVLVAEIAYGGIEPGNDTGTLSATSTAINVGNTGLDQDVQGESMCGTFSVSSECAPSASSTIPEDQQKFSSTTLSYGSVLATTLSSTTFNQVELDIPKTTSTSSPVQRATYWGIAVPVTITLAGSYTGLNTFQAVTAEAADW